MYEYTSRSEKRLNKLIIAAEKGKMSVENELLYGSEKKRLTRDGFSISSAPSSYKSLSNCTISWYKAFPNGVPLIVHNYITGVIETYPKSHITTLAQKLFVTASRAKAKRKAKTEDNTNVSATKVLLSFEKSRIDLDKDLQKFI